MKTLSYLLLTVFTALTAHAHDRPLSDKALTERAGVILDAIVIAQQVSSSTKVDSADGTSWMEVTKYKYRLKVLSVLRGDPSLIGQELPMKQTLVQTNRKGHHSHGTAFERDQKLRLFEHLSTSKDGKLIPNETSFLEALTSPTFTITAKHCRPHLYGLPLEESP